MKQQLNIHRSGKSNQLDSSVQSILFRLVKMAQAQFDVSLEFLFIGNQKPTDDWVFSKLKTHQYLVFPTDSYFPIRVDNNIIGAVHAHGELSGPQPQQMMELVGLIVDTTLKAAVDLSSLESLEEKLQLLEPTKNVIRMEHFQKKTSPLLQLLSTQVKKKTTRRFCQYIFDKDPQNRMKKSFDEHENSGNFAFVNIADLDASCFENIDDFASLGPMTVFIPEITDLVAPMQKFFADYFSADRHARGPSVVFGSRLPFFEPKVEFQVEPDLYEILKTELSYAPDTVLN